MSFTNNNRLDQKSLLKKIKDIKSLSKYDFIDLGSGDGSSLVNSERIIGGKGIGIEIDKRKVSKAAKLNREVYLGSALSLHKIPGKVKFVTCDNFLEHLPNLSDVEEMLRQAVSVAEEFIYIRHPSFEDIDYLAEMNLKTYWSHWTGHTSMVRLADFIGMFLQLGITDLKIVPVYKITDSDDDKILPLSAPIDQHNYVAEHGKKPKTTITFDRNIYYAFDILINVSKSKKPLPIIEYENRLKQTKHPKFYRSKEQQDIEKLSKEVAAFKQRKVIKIVERLAKITRGKIH